MRALRFAAVAAAIVAILSPFFACIAHSESKGGGERSSGHIQYFAYWDDADNRSYNALPEVYQETNLAWIAEQRPGNLDPIIDYHIDMLILSQLLGMNASLSLGYVFFQPGAVLYNNWRQRWTQYANEVEPYTSNVVDIYPFDEPYESAFVNHLALSEMQRELGEVCAAIRSRFPNVRLACVCQPFTIQRRLDLTMFDWVGFDAYEDPFDPKGVPTHEQWLTMLEEQLDVPASGRRTLVLPYACVLNGAPLDPYNSSDPTVADRVAQAGDYLALAERHPSVIGIVPFLYNSQPGLFGLDKMPPVHAAYQQMGREIIANKGTN